VVDFATAITAGHEEISDVDLQNIGDELSGSLARGADEPRMIPKMRTMSSAARIALPRVTLNEKMRRARISNLREKA
jgi:hypothetical protein